MASIVDLNIFRAKESSCNFFRNSRNSFKALEVGANLFNPENVKETIAKLKKGDSWRHAAICAYSMFARMQGLTWQKPKVKRIRRIPFIPLERELDDLIAASGRKTATFLQVLKETGMRAGEAISLQWTDIDFERHIITLNTPEKGGNPRVFKISPKLVEMLNTLKRKNIKVFPVSYTALKCNFLRARRKLAVKLGNPRLLQISFHTFRHWKATMEYHKPRILCMLRSYWDIKNLTQHCYTFKLSAHCFKAAQTSSLLKLQKLQRKYNLCLRWVSNGLE